jgi:hypothetical protein
MLCYIVFSAKRIWNYHSIWVNHCFIDLWNMWLRQFENRVQTSICLTVWPPRKKHICEDVFLGGSNLLFARLFSLQRPFGLTLSGAPTATRCALHKSLWAIPQNSDDGASSQARNEDLPSGNQSWLAGKSTIDVFPVLTSIYTGVSLAMFDYQRVLIIMRKDDDQQLTINHLFNNNFHHVIKDPQQ